MKRTDFTNLGGLKFTQNRLAFLQDSFSEVLVAIAKLCGDKTILHGVEVTGGNVSSGWISYNGEPIKFVGGSVAAQVVITENKVPLVFGNNSTHDVHFEKVATCGTVGDFPFSDLQSLLALQNTWMRYDIKQLYVPTADYDAYIVANYDAEGYGLGRLKGWRIFSKEVAASAGKVLVNVDSTDVIFNKTGLTGGSKIKTILRANLPAEKLNVPIPASKTSVGATGTGKITTGNESNEPIDANTLQTENMGSGTPLDVLNPYFVILTLIKL